MHDFVLTTPGYNRTYTVSLTKVRESQQQMPFYMWDEAANQVRWLCSWDTTEAEIDDFIDLVKQALTQS